MNELNNKDSSNLTRCGFVAIIGSPNAGKSTLLNSLVGQKVAIVTHKVQTTRNLISGVSIYDNSQIIFIDTPGIFPAEGVLEKRIVNTAIRGLKSADKIAMIIDPRCYKDHNNEIIMNMLRKHRVKADLIINKRDLVTDDKLLEVADYLYKQEIFNKVFMVSALKGYNISDITKYFAEALPCGPWLYDEDQVSDIPTRFLLAEITREKLYFMVHEEIPYASVVETEIMEQTTDGSVMNVMQTIYVTKENHKKIILGHCGRKIKHIGTKARIEMEEILEQKVFLKLFVKVRKNWINNDSIYHNMGVEAPQ